MIVRKSLLRVIVLGTLFGSIVFVSVRTYLHSSWAWLAQLKTNDAGLRFETLREMRDSEELFSNCVVRVALKTATDEDTEVRRYSAQLLGEAAYMGRMPVNGRSPDRIPDPKLEQDIIDGLIRLLQDESPQVRTEAAWGLIDCGTEGIHRTLPLIESERYDVRCAALKSLGMAIFPLEPGRHSRKEIRAFYRSDRQTLAIGVHNAVSDTDSELRRLGIEAAWQLEFGEDELKLILPPVIAALRDDDAYARERAAFALGQIALRRSETQFGPGLRLSEEAAIASQELSQLSSSNDSSQHGRGAVTQAIVALRNIAGKNPITGE